MKIYLNREQLTTLNRIVEHFTEVNEFLIEAPTNPTPKIGQGLTVSFNLYNTITSTIELN